MLLCISASCAGKEAENGILQAEDKKPEVVVLDMPVGPGAASTDAQEASGTDNTEEDFETEPEEDNEEVTEEEAEAEREEMPAADDNDVPEEASKEPQPFWFEDTKVAHEHSQLRIVGDANGTTAPFTLYEKDEGSVWTEVFSVTSYIGRHGYNDNRHQGDETTPTGVYHFTQAFGIADDPGCTIGYTKVNEHHYWVGNSDSPYYNTMISDLDTSNFSKKSSEHLIAYDVPYQYCLNISFNSEQTPGRGSAIFLHCYSERQDTGGCVAIPQKYMKQLLCRLKPDCVIAIDADTDDLNGEVH